MDCSMLAEDPPAFWGIHPLKYSQNSNYFIWSYILILSKVIGLAVGITIFIWSCFQIHAVEFPVIARMARDYLAIPATSVAVERVFSKSRHICANLRSSLKEKTIMMALLTKVWIRSGLFEMTAPTELRWKHGDNGKKWGPYIPTVLWTVY